MLTTAAIFRDPWETYSFRSRLQAEGLLAFLQYDHRVAVDRMRAFAIGGVHVQVDDEAPEARGVIARRLPGRDARHVGDLDDPHCPACGSRDFRRRASAPQVASPFPGRHAGAAGKLAAHLPALRQQWEDDAAVASTS